MVRLLLALCAVLFVVCPGGIARSEVSGLPEAAPAEPGEATAEAEPIIPALSERQTAQMRVWLEDLKKFDARRARETIVRVGPGAVPLLLEALEQSDAVQGQQIVEVLGRIGHKSALPKLHELMQGDNVWLRSAAVFAIGKIGGKEAIPILLEGLRDPSSRVCEITVQVLVALGDLRAAPGLIDLLRSPDQDLAQSASQALVALTDGTEDHGMDWMSWQLWYESEALAGGLGNGISGP